MMSPELSREIHRQSARLMRGVLAGAAAIFILYMSYPAYLAASDPGPTVREDYSSEGLSRYGDLLPALAADKQPRLYTQRQASNMAIESAMVGAAFILLFYSAAVMLFTGITLVSSVSRTFGESDADPLPASGRHPLR